MFIYNARWCGKQIEEGRQQPVHDTLKESMSLDSRGPIRATSKPEEYNAKADWDTRSYSALHAIDSSPEY